MMLVLGERELGWAPGEGGPGSAFTFIPMPTRLEPLADLGPPMEVLPILPLLGIRYLPPMPGEPVGE